MQGCFHKNLLERNVKKKVLSILLASYQSWGKIKYTCIPHLLDTSAKFSQSLFALSLNCQTVKSKNDLQWFFNIDSKIPLIFCTQQLFPLL